MTDSSPLSFEEASARYLPAGLAGSDLREMYEDLARLDQGTLRFYSSDVFDFSLQGDGFTGAPFPVFDIGEPRIARARVMLLTNTCDMSLDNRRSEPVRVTLAPVVRLSRYRTLAMEGGVSEQTFDGKVAAMRLHRVSSVFLLPAGATLEEESIVLFDRLQSLPLSVFHEGAPQRIFTLSNQAFWLLTVKLSIHFSRLQEGVSRRAA